MMAIGAGILLMALKNNIAPLELISVSLVAASFKFTDALLFPLPLTHITIINPAQAIIMEGVSFGVIAHFFRSFEKSLASRAAFSALLVAMSIVLFNVVSYFLIGYKNTMHLESILRTLVWNLPVGILATSFCLYAAGRVPAITAVPVALRAVAAAVVAVFAVVLRAVIS
jgi:hypothetical protein